MTAKPKSAFREWFEAQFGKRPSSKSRFELKEELDRCNYATEKARSALNESILYDEWMKAARYAWFTKERERGNK